VRGVPLTPEQREARKAARRALARRVALRSAFGTLALVAVLAIAAWWLLTTIGGRDVLLRQIVARLPAGTTLTWQRAEGPASGPLTLHGVRFETPRALDADCVARPGRACASAPIVFTAQRVVLDPALRPLLGRTLRLDALAVTRATLELPETTQAFELPRWPDSLPQIAPPLALQADAMRIDGLKVTREHVPLIDIRHAGGGLDAAAGRLHVEHLTVDSDRGRFAVHGDYVPRDDYRMDLTATAVLPAPAGRTPPSVGLVARGDLAAMEVAVAGNAPAPVRATLHLRGKQSPRWTLQARSDALDPGLLLGTAAGTPMAFDLRAEGSAGDATVQGRVTRGDLSVRLQQSKLSLTDQVLSVQPLVVDTFDGRITLRGRADFRDPANASLRFAVNARGLAWGGAEGKRAVHADADFGIAGKPDAWAAIGNATLLRETQSARVHFDGNGDQRQVSIRSVRMRMPGGALDANGRVRWSPALQWNIDARLAGFDPGYFFPGWNGALDGRIASSGRARPSTSSGHADGFDATADVPSLTGRLRGRQLRGNGTFAMQGDAYRGKLALSLGDSRIEARGTMSDVLDIDARFSPLQLADLLPHAGGTLRGTLRLTGARNAPDIAAQLTGSGLHYGSYRADSLLATGHLPWRGSRGSLLMDARGLQAGIALDALHVDARGAIEDLHVVADARGDLGAIALTGKAARRGADWNGSLQTMRVAPTKGAAWQLPTPAKFAQHAARWTLSRSCFASGASATLCATADWPRRGVDIEGHGLPLTLATPYLPPRTDGRPWLLRGDIALAVQVRPVRNGWRGIARLSSASGGLRNSERARRDLVAYDQLQLDATFDPRHVDAKLGAGLNGNGRIDAHVATGWDAYAPLSGDLALRTDALTWMELLSPDIVEPTGHLDGRIALSGTRAQPALGGQARLSDFSTELPALAIVLADGDVRLDAQSDGSARIRGDVRSGDGVLHLDGTLGWGGRSGQQAPLVLNVTGKNVLASDTRDLRAVIDPDVVVRYAAGQPLDVTGRIGVPSARLDLERLDRGAATSPDVVVLDPVDKTRGLATPLVLDLTLALGNDVRLSGFGLDGTLGGSLRVRSQPGREMVATGTLDVGGRYLAYGQALDITRGRLVWSNTPIADPVLDIRAEREVGDVTAGIDVSGHATRPQAEVWTDPATDQSEALAYLALGRPLSSASSEESRQLNAASAALSAGGNLLASQLGAKLGLDSAGVSESRALGGSVLGIGKYLSPKLYVGYGVSLLGTGQVLTLKYLLRKGFDIEVESSTIENRASVNWRKEK
jgi:translocation and assembly module TamB